MLLRLSIKTLASPANTRTIFCNGYHIQIPAQLGVFPPGTFTCAQLLRLVNKIQLNNDEEDAMDETETDDTEVNASLTPVKLRYTVPAECGCSNVGFADDGGEGEHCTDSVADSKYQVTYTDSSCVQGTFDPSTNANCKGTSGTYTTCTLTFEVDSSKSSFSEIEENDVSPEGVDAESLADNPTAEDGEEPSTRVLAQDAVARSVTDPASASAPRFAVRSLLTLAVLAALALQ
ncbi:hypothetical protein ON010_g1831 [Phytophthora cinnamomi]|nr:hypothetical protein ON010_g1831 [Phytophthora cinnamomi]